MSKRKKYPDQLFLKECFNYAEGQLYWKHRPLSHFSSSSMQKTFNTRFAGIIAGSVSKGSKGKCYRFVRIGRRNYAVHAVIWIINYGDYEGTIDHVDGDGTNNALDNLRVVSFQENQKNRKTPRHNTSGHVGVYYREKSGRWYALIGVNGKMLCIGTFDEKLDAIKARKKAEKRYGYHENHGRK